MYKGAFRIWENVLGIGGTALAVAFLIVDVIFPEIPHNYFFGCVMIMVAAFFPRPIWLAANWGRLSRGRHLSVTVSYDLPIHTGGKGGQRRLITLKFGGKKKNCFEKTIFDGIPFMSHVEGSQYEAYVDTERPDEFVIMPAAWTNAVVFAAVGVIIEIALVVWTRTF